MEALLEVVMALGRLISVRLEDDMSEECCEFSSANIVGCEAEGWIVFIAELRVKPGSYNERVIGVETISHREQEVPVVLTEHIHDASHILFVFVFEAWAAL